jgi:hypothetical protein
VNVRVNCVQGPLDDESRGVSVVTVYRILVPFGACHTKSAVADDNT